MSKSLLYNLSNHNQHANAPRAILYRVTSLQNVFSYYRMCSLTIDRSIIENVPTLYVQSHEPTCVCACMRVRVRACLRLYPRSHAGSDIHPSSTLTPSCLPCQGNFQISRRRRRVIDPRHFRPQLSNTVILLSLSTLFVSQSLILCIISWSLGGGGGFCCGFGGVVEQLVYPLRCLP